MKHINVVLLGFFNRDGSILLNRRNDSEVEVWGLLGGGIEANEDPRVALKREILEEVHYELNDHADEVEFIDTFSTVFNNYAANAYIFRAKFPGFYHFSESDEVGVADLKLFSVAEAVELSLLPLTRSLLEDGAIR